MKALVTGASGFIGYHVARLLREDGTDVRALVRRTSPVDDLRALGIELFFGDLRDAAAVKKSVQGCDQVYHVAADYRLWAPDSRAMYAINVTGTENVMQAALEAGIATVVHTGSVGTLAASTSGRIATESTPVGLDDMVGHYKRSKFMANRVVAGYVQKGLAAVIVHPSTPVGPMDRKPTPTGRIIVDFVNGRMPAYLDTGLNFADVADVAAGHLLAARRGRPGRAYILGNRNMTLRRFFDLLAAVTGRPAPRVRLPYGPLLAAAHINEAFSRLTGIAPKIPLTGVKMARKYMYFECRRAVEELDLPQHPVEDAVAAAVKWFRDHGYIRRNKL